MGKTAFLFAGQGAQNVGMGKDIVEAIPEAAEIFSMGEEIRTGITGICFGQGSESDGALLGRTINTQPALFLTDLAIAVSLRAAGIVPDAVAGFSLGEIPAAAFAGVLSYEEAFRLVLLRGESMDWQSALHPGGMAAVLKLDAPTVERLCADLCEVWPVNYNCPGQISCAGKAESIDALCTAAKAAGGRAVRLPVSGAFHTPYMQKVAPILRAFLDAAEVCAPAVALYANRTGMPYPADRDGITECLTKQVCSPVRWEDTLRRMWEDGIDTFVEVGAWHTLTGFVNRTLPEACALTVNDVDTLKTVVARMRNGGGA